MFPQGQKEKTHVREGLMRCGYPTGLSPNLTVSFYTSNPTTPWRRNLSTPSIKHPDTRRTMLCTQEGTGLRSPPAPGGQGSLLWGWQCPRPGRTNGFREELKRMFLLKHKTPSLNRGGGPRHNVYSTDNAVLRSPQEDQHCTLTFTLFSVLTSLLPARRNIIWWSDHDYKHLYNWAAPTISPCAQGDNHGRLVKKLIKHSQFCVRPSS